MRIALRSGAAGCSRVRPNDGKKSTVRRRPLNFYLKSNLGEKDVAKLTVTDAGGKKVREIECRAAKLGAAEVKKPPEDEDSPMSNRRLAKPRRASIACGGTCAPIAARNSP